MKSEPNLVTSSRDEKFCIAILKSCAIMMLYRFCGLMFKTRICIIFHEGL